MEMILNMNTPTPTPPPPQKPPWMTSRASQRTWEKRTSEACALPQITGLVGAELRLEPQSGRHQSPCCLCWCPLAPLRQRERGREQGKEKYQAGVRNTGREPSSDL